jgi:hypothetical protein
MALKIGSSAILLCDIVDAPNYNIANVLIRPWVMALFQRGRRVVVTAEPGDMVCISSPDDMTLSVYIGPESLKPCRGRPRIFDFRA